MNTTLKKKQASRENGKLGGVKTDAGKSVSKMNATKHGILSRTDFDTVSGLKIYEQLAEEFGVKTPSRKILVQQLALTMLRLTRCARMENEIIREALDPPIIEEVLNEGVSNTSEMVTNHEGTPATISAIYFERIAKLSERYESRLVGRMLRLIDALKTG